MGWSMTLSEPDAPRASTTVSRYVFGRARFIVIATTAPDSPPWASKLTPAERAVLALLGRGMSNAEIAATRGCGVPTVAKQVSALKQKTACGERIALATLGRRFSRDDAPKELGARAALLAHQEGSQTAPGVALTDEHAASLWGGMVEGRWSLADEIDSHGQRLLAVREHDGVARARALSPRERDVLGLLLTGRANKVIAYELGVTASTVSLCIRSILTKTGMRDRAALALLAETLRACRASQ
jgi:DNA-binding NarL/FixJ family response regulator